MGIWTLPYCVRRPYPRVSVLVDNVGHWSDLDRGHYWSLPICHDEWLSAWTIPWTPTAKWTLVIFHPEGLLVDFVPLLRSLLAVITLPYQRNLVQRLWTSTSSVSGNPLAGSTHVHGPAAGDCFSLLCLVSLNIKKIFAYNDTWYHIGASE